MIILENFTITETLKTEIGETEWFRINKAIRQDGCCPQYVYPEGYLDWWYQKHLWSQGDPAESNFLSWAPKIIHQASQGSFIFEAN